MESKTFLFRPEGDYNVSRNIGNMTFIVEEDDVMRREFGKHGIKVRFSGQGKTLTPEKIEDLERKLLAGGTISELINNKEVKRNREDVAKLLKESRGINS